MTSEKRHPEMPELPTMTEAGIDGFVGFYWNGLLAPAGTPPAIIDRINTIINDGLTSDMRAAVIKLGMEPKSGSPQDFAAFIADEVQRWNVVVRDAKL